MDENRSKQEEIDRITNTVVDALGECDVESALTVVCNLAGQLVAMLSGGVPSRVQSHANNLAENIKKAAIVKLLYDDDQRRRELRELNGNNAGGR